MLCPHLLLHWRRGRKAHATAVLTPPVQALAANAAAPEEALAQAKALRRRIEYVLPTLF